MKKLAVTLGVTVPVVIALVVAVEVGLGVDVPLVVWAGIGGIIGFTTPLIVERVLAVRR